MYLLICMWRYDEYKRWVFCESSSNVKDLHEKAEKLTNGNFIYRVITEKQAEEIKVHGYSNLTI